MVIKRSNAENLDNYMVIDRSENIGLSLPCRFTPVEVVYYSYKEEAKYVTYKNGNCL